jgi:ABC-type polysaccharide/polyol phosphate transport system ATPase subunit
MITTASGRDGLRGGAPEVRGDASVAIEVRGINKVFRIPSHRIDSLKERALHPFRAVAYHELHALRDVSFDVKRGEFFGVVGRNGSGKSTLLKILASIYAADSGSVRVAGAIAPFIELGVGFNPELTARENVVLNGVMMGLSRREARRRLGSVLEFAELEEFAELKLKNYSSGMTVRLAFAVMIQSEADILLIDEVLAVGDASFQQKCAEVFADMRSGGRTVVLVTHDMAAVHGYCDRAMLLEAGGVVHLGEPEEAAREYISANFDRHTTAVGDAEVQLVPDLLVRVLRAGLEDARGQRVHALEVGERIRLTAALDARAELRDANIRFDVNNHEGATVFSVRHATSAAPERVPVGHQASVDVEVENPLAPGHYGLFCWVAVPRGGNEYAQQGVKLVEFEVVGSERGAGLVSVPGRVSIELSPPDCSAP